MPLIKKTFTALFTTIDSLIPSLRLGLVSLSSLALLSLSGSVAAQEDPSCSSGKKNPDGVKECLVIESVKQLNAPAKFSAYFKVTKDNGRVNKNIKPRDLEVSVNGTSQTLGPNPLTEDQGKRIPLRIVILLDYSGSMKDADAEGKTKLEGAVGGIQTFINRFPPKADVKLSVVPFAIANEKKCNESLVRSLLFNKTGRADVNNSLLVKFYSLDSADLQNTISNLGTLSNLCPDASTNLFEATAIALDFLSQRDNKELYPYPEEKEENKQEGKQNPKLILIVLTDGFNTERLNFKDKPTPEEYKDNIDNRCPNNTNDLNTLKSQYLEAPKSKEIKVYTIGYGNVPEGATCENYRRSPFNLKESQFVDKVALEQIAKAGRGFSSLKPTAEEINKIFKEIYEAISGGYDLQFSDLKADAGDKRTVEISVDIGNGEILKASRDYTIPAYQKVEWGDRTPLFLIILACLVLGGIPFSMWRSGLESD